MRKRLGALAAACLVLAGCGGASHHAQSHPVRHVPALGASVGLYPDPEPDATVYVPARTSGFQNGRLPDSALAPIYGGRLARNGAAAGWNTMNLYRATIGLGPLQTNGSDSTYRSYDRQVYWKQYWCGQGACGNAATPGTSRHGWGIAVDTSSGKAWVQSHGGPFGWGCSDAPWENWHVSTCTSFGRPDPGPDRRFPVLREGSGGYGQGYYVRRVEQHLGFRYPDGEFRHNTAVAVRRFEIRHRWRHAGVVVTRAVWVALYRRPVRRAVTTFGVDLTPWYADPGLVRRVQINVGWFSRVYGGLFATPAVSGRVTPGTKAAIKRSKYFLGYPDAQIAWASGVDVAFVERLHHPSVGIPELWVRRGVQRRRAAVPQHISDRGVRFIADFEGFESTYVDDGFGTPTVGYGHIERGVRTPITRTQGLALLKSDLRRYEGYVFARIHARLTQGELDALTSFVYNLGGGALDGGIAANVNAHHLRAAADEMLQYDHANGQRVLGLTRRREAERAMFLG